MKEHNPDEEPELPPRKTRGKFNFIKPALCSVKNPAKNFTPTKIFLGLYEPLS
jgi:hypothetical protein